MRYSRQILGAAFLGILVSSGCRNSSDADLAKARIEAQALKSELEKAKTDLDRATAEREFQKAELANLKDSLLPIRKGEDFPRPALEFVEEPNKVANFLDYNFIHVYRWRGGTLEGTIQFQTEAEPMKVDIEVTKRAKVLHAIESKDLPFEPRAVSGVIMIAIKSRKDATLTSDCLVGIDVHVAVPRKKGVPPPFQQVVSHGTSYKLVGAIDATKAKINYPPGPGAAYGPIEATSFFGSGDPTKKDYQDKKYEFYQLKVSTDAGK